MNYKLNNIYNEDCLAAMKQMPDNYFELAIVDVQYGIGEGKGQYKSRNANRIDKRTGKPILVKHNGYVAKEWDNKPPDKEYFDELIRVSKNQIVWGANHFISRIAYDSSCWIVWDKCNGNSDFADCELAWTSFKSAVRLFRFMWSGFCQGKSINEGHINQGNKKLCENRIHPTQKPVALYKWLLNNYAKKGDKIIDTHMGSGSSIIACYDLGFEYMAFELDTDYYNAAMKRINKHMSQQSIFDLGVER